MTASRTYRGVVEYATQVLFSSSDTPRIDAEVLILHVVQKPLAWLIAQGDSIASSEHLVTFYSLLAQRQQGQPIAYLVGYKEFWSLSLKVTPDVLIPRPDTETLVEQALSLLGGVEQPSVLDLGTGSGAIALALAKEIPNARITAVDASAAALEIARFNADRCKLDNVQFLQSDWFTQLDSMSFDFIAANPPYIDRDDPHLEQGDLRFEPSAALIANGDGLDDLRTIIQGATHYLKPNGHLIVEHGFDQPSKVSQLFEESGFIDIRQFRDLNNLIRCTAGKVSS